MGGFVSFHVIYEVQTAILYVIVDNRLLLDADGGLTQKTVGHNKQIHPTLRSYVASRCERTGPPAEDGAGVTGREPRVAIAERPRGRSGWHASLLESRPSIAPSLPFRLGKHNALA